jgi:hypothetical protein
VREAPEVSGPEAACCGGSRVMIEEVEEATEVAAASTTFITEEQVEVTEAPVDTEDIVLDDVVLDTTMDATDSPENDGLGDLD